MSLVRKYIAYIRDVRRYSMRTVSSYSDVLDNFLSFASVSEDDVLEALTSGQIRSYEIQLFDKESKSRQTVNQHLSVLSSFCNYLVKCGCLKSNPARSVRRLKPDRRLPHFYKESSMQAYFSKTEDVASGEFFDAFAQSLDSEQGKYLYQRRLARVLMSVLYVLGIRRAELIGLDVGDVDFSRKVLKVHGKGNKIREIPLMDMLCEEILLYLKAVELMAGRSRSLSEPLLVTYSGKRLYPTYVDRTVKQELSHVPGISGRRSPHVLRHSLATGLLNSGADLNSIKELLGHSSLAATQVYTHSTIAKLKNIYESAHPRAKNGGKHGD